MGFNLPKIIRSAFGGSYEAFLKQFDGDPAELNVNMVCHFIKTRKSLQRAMREKNWKRVAKLYNGSTRYAVKFEPHYQKAKSAGYV